MKLSHRRIAALLSLLVLTPVGFYSKFYSGPAAQWVNNSLVGVFYEIFWCLLLLFFFTRGKPGIIAAVVLLTTCALEFLQLWHPPFLEWLRGFFIGQTILGTVFTWSDFPYYVVGSGLGWLWVWWIQGRHPD